MSKDFFQDKSNNYEKDKNRVDNVQNIANLITKEIDFDKSMEIIDFGSGTGLLLEKIAPFVKSITAIDLSPSMNKKLNDKRDLIDCNLEILEIDLAKTKLEKKFDSIISSMTLHHIENIENLFKDFYNILNENGTIALADLDIEDGSFHTEDTGVYHFGFDRDEIVKIAKNVGFKNIKIQDASIAYKPQGGYPIFLLTASKYI
ncbi:class I SAM-dependent DNA methyltransferase [Arcobacter arenosus]|uniref:class I SAM-dependent DNA methyltransferase n=1 Tax=Arcobacter arenosus TaxID=2576037 RepID=UPI003BA8C4CA